MTAGNIELGVDSNTQLVKGRRTCELAFMCYCLLRLIHGNLHGSFVGKLLELYLIYHGHTEYCYGVYVTL